MVFLRKLERTLFFSIFALGVGLSMPAMAGDPDTATPASEWPEIETENIFGFIEGVEVGAAGEKEIAWQTIGRFGKSGGVYRALDHELSFGYTPNEYIHVELSALGQTYDIKNVPDMDDRRMTAFTGGSAEVEILLKERTPSSPFAISLKIEPEVTTRDETSGERVRSVGTEFRLVADGTLIANQLFWAASLLYEPEHVVHLQSDEGVERESTVGVSGALSYRFMPKVVAGVETQYFRHYGGLTLNEFDGDALYVGPTLAFLVTSKVTLSATWAHQVRGHVVDMPSTRLNLDEYDRDRAKLKLNVEF